MRDASCRWASPAEPPRRLLATACRSRAVHLQKFAVRSAQRPAHCRSRHAFTDVLHTRAGTRSSPTFLAATRHTRGVHETWLSARLHAHVSLLDPRWSASPWQTPATQRVAYFNCQIRNGQISCVHPSQTPATQQVSQPTSSRPSLSRADHSRRMCS